MSEHTDSNDDDFLHDGVYDAPAPTHGPDPAAATMSDAETESAGPPSSGGASAGVAGRPGWKAALRPAAWVAVGVLTGAIVVAAWHSSQSSTASTNPAAARGSFPGPGQLPNGQAPNGQAPNGQPPNGGPGVGGPAFGGPGQNGRPGEQRVRGTVTAVGASAVTVRLTTGGTATYVVIASSDIVKDGMRVSLAAVHVGDAVFLHVYPLNGRTVVEHLFAGEPPGPGGANPGGPPPPGNESGTTRT